MAFAIKLVAALRVFSTTTLPNRICAIDQSSHEPPPAVDRTGTLRAALAVSGTKQGPVRIPARAAASSPGNRVMSWPRKLLTAAMPLFFCGVPMPAAAQGDQVYDFEIAQTKGEIYNPWTGGQDPVELRSFRGGGADDGSFVAPTIRVAPGSKLTVNLDNRLDPCTDEQIKAHRCYNETNLHTHGLWVSPSGNSDNVLVTIPPGGQFRYQYDIPKDHPAGTFWYHPHRHGSGFVQVGSGMAGALIVTGDRVPTHDNPGDVDILLKDEKGQSLAERVMLFQQIQYACLDESGQIEGRMEKGDYIRPWTCAPGRVGRIESDDNDWNWQFSGRFTGINGKVQPRLPTGRVGRFERWRLIHAGTRERIRLQVRLLDPAAPELHDVRGEDQEQWIARFCNGPALPLWHVAMDGLTRSSVFRSNEAVLFTGDRMDVLVNYPEAGRYCLVQESPTRDDEPQPRRVLAVVNAEGKPAKSDPDALLQQLLVQSAERALAGPANGPIRDKITAELRNGLSLASFVWHKSVPQAEVSGYREAILNILAPPETNFLMFHINGRSYDHQRMDFILPLGATEEWHVTSFVGGHPLHIHVNPFQIVKIQDPQGRDVTDPNGEAYDPDYAGLLNEWKDTVFIKQNHRIIFRTRYQRFTGDFVTHCHIMFHGDHGMMMNLRIADTGASPSEPTHD